MKLGHRLSVAVFCCFFLLFLSAEVLADDSALSIVPSTGDDDDSATVVTSETEEQIEEPYSGEPFIATNEWQVVKPGQHIPAGLHVRLNIQTGEKTAKLMDEPANKKDAITVDGKPYSFNEIKETLKNIKNEIPTENKSEEKQFRSYEEMKKDFAENDVSVKSDIEMMRELINAFPGADDDKKAAILLDLEFLVHQIDNGVNFVDMGGLALVKPYLNASLPVLRQNTALLIGAAAQSNPKVQIAAVENGVLRHLVTSLPMEMDTDVRKKYLFTIGSIVRHFPLAQKQLMELGGVEILLSVLADSSRTTQDKKRVLTLVYDLLTEREHVNEGEDAAKAEQYADAPFRHALVDAGVCRLLPTALAQLPGLDGQQKVVELFGALKGECDDALRQSRPMLGDLRRRLSASLSEDDDDDLLRHLVQTLDRLLGQSSSGKMEL